MCRGDCICVFQLAFFVFSGQVFSGDIEHKQDGIEFNQDGTDADQVNDDVSLIELLSNN